ncbi:MAG: PQQ-binding-like beta-propeller repeat protein [Sedimentisphaerales bacterium]|nr:PQQ-binding-like beta-propeller repeat protein [Sedimentisphaerales bacterium]
MNSMKICVAIIVLWGASVFAAGLSTSPGDYLVASELLDKAGLESRWQVNLPMKPNEKIDTMYVYDNYLYVLTTQNFLFSIDRSTGHIRSLLQLAVPGLPVLPPMHFDKKSIFLVGQEMKVFDPAFGQILETITLKNLGGNYGGIARNQKYAYVCGSDNRLYAYTADEGIRAFMVSADNDSAIISVIASELQVWFSTLAGNVIAMDADSGRKVWQFNLSGPMKAPLVLDKGYIYAAGMDTKLYKLNSMIGTQAWEKPFFAGDKVEMPLTVGQNCVYVYTVGTGIYAVDKQTGKALWNQPQGYAVLAEHGSRVYVYVKPGVLSVMDNIEHKEHLGINIARINRVTVNMTDSWVYLGSDMGRILAACPFEQKNQAAESK